MQAPLNIGAYRFEGANISFATSASDIFAHAAEVLGAVEAMHSLQRSFQKSGKPCDQIVEAVLKAVAGRIAGDWDDTGSESSLVAGVACQDTSVSPASLTALLSESRLPAFVNKVKSSLLTEKGLYRKFLDTLSDYMEQRLSDFQSAVTIFRLLHHRHSLLSEFSNLIFQVSIPTSFLVAAPVSLDRYKPPVRLAAVASSELQWSNHISSLHAHHSVTAANVLADLDLARSHHVPLSIASRLKKLPRLHTVSKPPRTSSTNSLAGRRTGTALTCVTRTSDSASSLASASSFTSDHPGSTSLMTVSRRSAAPPLSSITQLLEHAEMLARTQRADSGTSASGGSVSGDTELGGRGTPPRRLTRAMAGKRPDSAVPGSRDAVDAGAVLSVAGGSRGVDANGVSADGGSTKKRKLELGSKRKNSGCSGSTVSIAESVDRWNAEKRKNGSRRVVGKTAESPGNSVVAKDVKRGGSTKANADRRRTQMASKDTAEHPSLALGPLFQPTVPLPSAPNSSDPSMDKKALKSVSYIVKALLNHQSAAIFRDYKSPSGLTSRTDSRCDSPLTTIPDGDSSIPAASTKDAGLSMFNLSSLCTRLQAGLYVSPEQVKRDFEGMLMNYRDRNALQRNAKSFGVAALDVVELDYELVALEKLETYFRNEWAYFFPAIDGKRRFRGSGASERRGK